MNHVVIIAPVQFGYHIDTYYYCKHLRGRCHVTYIGWDNEFPAIVIEGINVISVNRRGGPYRVIRFLQAVWQATPQASSIVFIKYCKFTSWIIRIIRPRNPMVLDIRTGSVAKNALARRCFDALMKIEALFFKNVTIISEGLAKKLNLETKTTILPLGAEIISPVEKNFESCRMLYVGTFYNRNLENVIRGLGEYFSQQSNTEEIFLTIVGDGIPGQLEALIAEAKRIGVHEFIEFRGRVPHDQLRPIFDNHNVGIAYIPLTSFYDDQPPTKTFEYLMSGMPVIATKTKANQQIINYENGILIGDASHDVCSGIGEMVKKLNHFSSCDIRASVRNHEWSRIVNNLYIYLTNIK